MDMPTRACSIVPFALAGLCQLAGGYLVWLWLRAGRAAWLSALGDVILFLHGVLSTLQTEGAGVGRVYAADGGVFVALSLAWGWWVDGVRPDH